MTLASMLPLTGGALFVSLTLLWLLSLALSDVSIVDIFWGLGFVLCAWIAYGVGSARQLLPPLLVTLWGLRLSGYLARRNLGHGEDYRYQQMRRKVGPRFPLVSWPLVFLLQGVLIWVVSLPLQFCQTGEQPPLSPLSYVGVGIFVIGLFFETTADLQLARFKADPHNVGQVMDRGLWRYTRHPNYFGDFLIWWGLFVLCASLGAPLATGIAPCVMTFLLLRVSGVALLEKDIHNRRPGYKEYIQRTSPFFPWPPKRLP